MAGECDLCLGQGAGLVHAQDGHRADVVDGGEPLHHHLAPGHAHGAAGERDGHDHRQQFRRHADRQRQREQERFENRPRKGQMRQQHEQHHEAGQPQNEHAERMQAAFKRAGRLRGFERRRDAAETRAVARGRHQHHGSAAHQRGPAKKGIESFGGRCRGAWAGPLVDGKGFSGKQGLVGLRAGSLKHDAVGRNEIAGGKLDDIARHQFLDRRFADAAIAPYRRTNRNRMLERLHGLFGIVLLRHLERDGKGNDDKNDGAAGKIADGARDDGRDDKNGDERVGQPVKNFRADVAPRRLGDHVAADLKQAAARLDRVNPASVVPSFDRSSVALADQNASSGGGAPVGWSDMRASRSVVPRPFSRTAWPSPFRWPWPYPSARHICRAARR